MERIERIIENYARFFKLDLTGLTVFTEAASGIYRYNALISAMFADKTYAIVKPYRNLFINQDFTSSQIMRRAENLALEWGVKSDKLKFVKEPTPQIISKCDIITNSGFVRPITREMIGWMKPTTVIPLMYDSWEFRPEDIDIGACSEKQILVMGTDEENKFGGSLYPTTGYLALKMLFEAGLEVYGSNVIILGERGNVVTENVMNVLQKLDIRVVVVKSMDEVKTPPAIDAIIVTDTMELNSYNVDGTQIIHIPNNTSYLGPKYVIGLFMGGLKVGESMARARLDGKNIVDSIYYALDNSPATWLKEFKVKQENPFEKINKARRKQKGIRE